MVAHRPIPERISGKPPKSPEELRRLRIESIPRLEALSDAYFAAGGRPYTAEEIARELAGIEDEDIVEPE